MALELLEAWVIDWTSQIDLAQSASSSGA